MPTTLAQSYRFCNALARRTARNFYPAFWVLPSAQRRAMCALYAFMRVTDDLSDEPGQAEKKRVAIERWRDELGAALEGKYAHPLHAALHHTVESYAIPRRYLDDVLDGVLMDLVQTRYATFDELYRYCYRVASAVGLACIHIWGFKEESANKFAESAGIALQLTNILRDLREDRARGRVYLPEEDLDRFGYDETRLEGGVRDDCFRALMRFEVERARSYYVAARPLSDLLYPPGRAVFQVMTRTYEGLLDAIEKQDYDVFSQRVSLSWWRKAALAVKALPVRWGLR